MTAFTPSNRLKLDFELAFSPQTEHGIYLGFWHDPKMKVDENHPLESGVDWKTRDRAYIFRCGQGREDFCRIESLGKRGDPKE